MIKNKERARIDAPEKAVPELAECLLQRFQIFNEVSFFGFCEVELFEGVVVAYDVPKGRKPSIMVKSAFSNPKTFESLSNVRAIRRTAGLEIVDSDLVGRMCIPSGFGKQRRYMARCAPRFTRKQ